MDTVSPDSRSAHVVRLGASLLALAFVALCLLVVLGPSLAAALQPATDDALLGPFRWAPSRNLA